VSESLNIAIQVNGLSKAYPVYDRKRHLISEVITGSKRHREFWALKDISFEVPRGQIVGVIGSNGSGKSTLLRIITGVLNATTGAVEVRGRISAILELGTGFHPDFTGRENIITGGMCAGMSRQEVERKLPDIIEFSELGSVIDEPFRTYSSGMQARLTFSTAVAVDPEILVVDEALAAGDAYFVAKSMRRIRQICDSGATVLFVSHGTGEVARLCDTAMWIEAGRMRAFGPAREVTRRYDYALHERISNRLGKVVDVEPQALLGLSLEVNKSTTVFPSFGDDGLIASDPSAEREVAQVFRRGPVIIEDIRFLDGKGSRELLFRTWDPFTIEIDYRVEGNPPADRLGVAIAIERDHDLLLIAQFDTVNSSGNTIIDRQFNKHLGPPRRMGTIRVQIDELQLLAGDYLLSLGLLPDTPGDNHFFEYHHRLYRFRVIPSGYPSGAVFYPAVHVSEGARSS
jgi:ABC-type polysaccharide/polyol phosphate transport system ATPase subunit